MDKITQLQTLLKENGYNIETDGNWGPKSQAAYDSFSTKNKVMGAVDKAGAMFNPVTALYNSIPLNVRSLGQDVLLSDGILKAFPRTENDLDDGEMEAVRKATRKAYSEGRTNVTYEDYGTHLDREGNAYQAPTADVDPTSGNTWDMAKKTVSSEDYNAKTTYGRYDTFIPPGTTDTLLIDQYNFNNAVPEDMSTEDRLQNVAESANGYGTPRSLGTNFGSANGSGRRSVINISEKRTGGRDTYRNGGMKYYRTAGVDDSMYSSNEIPEGYNSATAPSSGSYSTESNTVSNQLYTPGNEQDLASQQASLNAQGPDSEKEQAEISGKFNMANKALDTGLKLADMGGDPIDMAADNLISDQDAGTYKWWEAGGDIATGIATGNYLEAGKDVVMKWSERNQIQRAEEKARKEHELSVNTLAGQRDAAISNQRMQSGINFGQDFSTNQQKYSTARYGGREKYETGGSTLVPYDQFNKGINSNTGAINQTYTNNDGTVNDWNNSLYGGTRVTPNSKDWDASSDSLMHGTFEDVAPMQERMGLNGVPLENGKYTDPNSSATGKERSDYRKNLINNNNYRRSLFQTRQSEMKDNTAQRVSENNAKFGSKGAEDIMSGRDARRMEKYGNTKSGFGNFLSNIFSGNRGGQGKEEMATGGVPLPGGKVYDLPSGAKKYVGAKHEQGGIDKNSQTNVEDQETEEEILGQPYIFSSHLKKGGASYAEQHEEILYNDGSDEDKIELAIAQEKQAGRDPKKLFMRNGGKPKSKYATGGALSGMNAPQKRQYFINTYGYDPGSDYDWGDGITTSPAGPGNNDSEVSLTLPTPDAYAWDSPQEEKVPASAASKTKAQKSNENNKLSWKQKDGSLKPGLAMDALTGVAAMAPVARALRNANTVDKMPQPGASPSVNPAHIKYGNLNRERAQNENDYQKVVNFIQTQGGTMQDQMAVYQKKLDANSALGTEEKRGHREVDNLNANAIFEAAKFNATGKAADIKNKMYVDDFNLASKAASEDATVEAMQVGAENLATMNKDRKLQNSADRLAAAIDGGSGVLMREKYGKEDYENLVKAARTGDVDALRKLEEWSIELNAEMGQKATDQKGNPAGKQ